MIRIKQVKVPISHAESDLKEAVFKKLNVSYAEIYGMYPVKRSLDAREKNNIHYVYTVDIEAADEEYLLKKNQRNPWISITPDNKYKLPSPGKLPLKSRPVVAGSGPAGLFCAYFLAECGFNPILIERGADVDSRIRIVSDFWNGKGPLNPGTNVQFGEGGAGTFSDGKLSTGINDPCGRNSLVLETFVKNGAGREILCDNKPHLGTDTLSKIVKKMRSHIIECGGTVLFNTTLADLNISGGKLESVEIQGPDLSEQRDDVSHNSYNLQTLQTSDLILAVGHSARDTFKMIYNRGLEMEPKAFAVGVRIEHPSELINEAQYGRDYNKKYGEKLPPADYKLTCRTRDGRSVYSFCMCPGGFVVDSSSEEGALCINGMSYSGRDGKNSNSAIVAAVSPEDYGADKSFPLKGIEFQRKLETAAFAEGKGAVPIQRFEDFEQERITKEYGYIKPALKGKASFGDINKILPDYICKDIKEAIHIFAGKVKGFDAGDALLSAVESRTSSPVRILRNNNFESNIKGIFPCGEGAGYAGGIVSAAIDGIKIFEELYSRYSVSGKGTSIP